ncbi:MAG: sulfite exporter TauE/SafE family protein, partial [Planctomycetota bacterium]
FLGWLVLVYVALGVLIGGGGHLGDAVANWPIAVAMAIGSYIAGSTPMGGGTIGFPVLVLIFDEPATIGRDFSFAIQAIGMTSASIYILARRLPIAWRVLAPAMLGSMVGTPLGAILIAPLVDDLLVKLLFAITWAGFGIAQLRLMRDLLEPEPLARPHPNFERAAGAVVGFFGGLLIASITGVGVDMLLFVILVLLFRVDARCAIASSVLLMTVTSIVGLSTNALAFGIPAEVWLNWYAAAPVVAIGAPLGALAASLIPRGITLGIVSTLCVVQFIAFCAAERISGWPLAISLIALATTTMAFSFIGHWGDRRSRKGPDRSQDFSRLRRPAGTRDPRPGSSE